MVNIYRHVPDIHTLSREYSPSSCVTDIRKFTDAYAARSAAVRDQSPDRRTIQYGASSAEVLDFFPAPSLLSVRIPRPVLAYIHGGYWQELSKDDHSFPADALRRHDFSYVAIGYGLAPAATLDEMVERCRRAILWIAQHCEEFAIDPGAIHVAGSSAGAHLAAMTGMTDWSSFGLAASPIRSLTLLSGVFDLRPLMLTYVNDVVRMTEEAAMRNSPLLLLDTLPRLFPQTLIVYGDNETGEFKRQSVDFFDALTRKGYVARLQEIRGRNHFDLPFDLADESTDCGSISLRHFGSAANRVRNSSVDMDC